MGLYYRALISPSSLYILNQSLLEYFWAKVAMNIKMMEPVDFIRSYSCFRRFALKCIHFQEKWIQYPCLWELPNPWVGKTSIVYIFAQKKFITSLILHFPIIFVFIFCKKSLDCTRKCNAHNAIWTIRNLFHLYSYSS